MIIELPISKYKVEVRERITYGEYQKIENFMVNKSIVKVVDDEKNIEISGALMEQNENLISQTFLHDCTKPDGDKLSTIGLIDNLDAEDGQFLANTIADIYDGIKKKLGKKGKK